MRLPDFLIIGAMKSGTTGLFMDLCEHPRIYLPDNKEPHFLCSDKVLSEEGQQEYAALYTGAGPEQLVGDGSTGYSKLPDRPGVIERAVAVLPDNFRAIYIIREPISRIISQHYHEFTEGKVGPDIDREVRRHARYVDFSRYHWQLQPWIEAIGRDRVHVVFFENYKLDRAAEVARTCEFLGLDSAELTPLDESKVHNAGDGKPVPSQWWVKFRQNTFYKNAIRPLVSPKLRPFLQKFVMKKAPPRPAPPSQETLDWLAAQLSDDMQALEQRWGPLPWERWKGLTATPTSGSGNP